MTQELSNKPPERSGKRIHVALPIRVTYWDSKHKPCLEMACTHDISSRGARITGLRCVKATGEVPDLETALALINAGASRLGISSVPAFLPIARE